MSFDDFFQFCGRFGSFISIPSTGKMSNFEKKLKEAKELLEIDMMSKEEFEELKKELAPIITNKKED